MHTRSIFLFASLGLAACSSASTSTGTGTGGTGSSTSSSTGTGGSTTGTGGAGTGGAPFTPGQPLATPAGQWTWVPFDNAFCADGSPTGLGVNLSSTPGARPLIYFEGGGACWSEITCYTLMTASYFTGGYGEADFAGESTDPTYLALPGGFFDRTAAANPFQDYSYIYVPYCTGDVFAGNNVATYGTNKAHYVGYANVTAYLERIVPTFSSADRVILAGSSAGGLGAAYNWWQTQQAFGETRVDLIDDSGTPMPADIEAEGMGEQAQRTAWGIDGTLPPTCAPCKQSLVGLLAFYDQQYPTHRATLLSYIEDSVLPEYYQISESEFEQGLNEDISTYFTASSPFKYFTVNAAGHVLWFSPTLTPTTGGGVTVQQFLTQMVTDDPTWASAHP